jgi:hypothetical protein
MASRLFRSRPPYRTYLDYGLRDPEADALKTESNWSNCVRPVAADGPYASQKSRANSEDVSLALRVWQ